MTARNGVVGSGELVGEDAAVGEHVGADDIGHWLVGTRRLVNTICKKERTYLLHVATIDDRNRKFKLNKSRGRTTCPLSQSWIPVSDRETDYQGQAVYAVLH